jgi:hypothetical protein
MNQKAIERNKICLAEKEKLLELRSLDPLSLTSSEVIELHSLLEVEKKRAKLIAQFNNNDSPTPLKRNSKNKINRVVVVEKNTSNSDNSNNSSEDESENKNELGKKYININNNNISPNKSNNIVNNNIKNFNNSPSIMPCFQINRSSNSSSSNNNKSNNSNNNNTSNNNNNNNNNNSSNNNNNSTNINNNNNNNSSSNNNSNNNNNNNNSIISRGSIERIKSSNDVIGPITLKVTRIPI